VWKRMTSGRLKVFKNLQHWLGEYRIYRRDEDGKVLKENDHLMDCTRYLANRLEIAETKPYGADEDIDMGQAPEQANYWMHSPGRNQTTGY